MKTNHILHTFLRDNHPYNYRPDPVQVSRSYKNRVNINIYDMFNANCSDNRDTINITVTIVIIIYLSQQADAFTIIESSQSAINMRLSVSCSSHARDTTKSYSRILLPLRYVTCAIHPKVQTETGWGEVISARSAALAKHVRHMCSYNSKDPLPAKAVGRCTLRSDLNRALALQRRVPYA